MPNILNSQKAEEYLRRALEKKTTYEAALMMRALYRHKANPEMEIYWDDICKELLNKNIHTETIIPNILKNSQQI